MPADNFFTHLFLPHHSNNQKPKLLHPSTLMIIAFLFVFIQSLLNFLPKAGVKILGYAANIPVESVFNLTNEKRKAAGLPELKLDPVLSQAAKNKGEDMLAKDYWAHISPDGVEPWKFFLDAGYQYRYAGENLARDFSNASSAVEAWMASPSHRDNLLSDRYEDMGIAVVEGDLNGVDTTIIVQLFGKRLAGGGEVAPIAKNTSVVSQAQAKGLSSAAPAASSAPKPSPQAVVSLTSPAPSPSAFLTGRTGEEPQSKISLSPFLTIKNLSLFLISFLMLIFVVDAIYVSRKGISRISGRNLAHLSFLGMILIIALIIRSGKIL